MPSAAFAARIRALGSADIRFAVWTIPSPYAPVFIGVSGAARLVSTPSRLVAPGLARDCHVTGFPDFEQFCIAGFPASTQVLFKSSASAIPPRPHGWPINSSLIIQAAKRNLSFFLWLLPHDVDDGDVEVGLDVGGVIFFDHLDAGAAVFGDLHKKKKQDRRRVRRALEPA